VAGGALRSGRFGATPGAGSGDDAVRRRHPQLRCPLHRSCRRSQPSPVPSFVPLYEAGRGRRRPDRTGAIVLSWSLPESSCDSGAQLTALLHLAEVEVMAGTGPELREAPRSRPSVRQPGGPESMPSGSSRRCTSGGTRASPAQAFGRGDAGDRPPGRWSLLKVGGFPASQAGAWLAGSPSEVDAGSTKVKTAWGQSS
jgi:hypothetical protein